MNMFGHDHVSHDDEVVALAGLLHYCEKPVATACGAQERQSAIAGAGDKVQVMGAVGAMQTAGHEEYIVQAVSCPALAKCARLALSGAEGTGHPLPKWERKKR
jgi:hypothetical protein